MTPEKIDEPNTEKKPDAELAEQELDRVAGGIGEQYGRKVKGGTSAPSILPYIEQD